jgi:hypothetical protein
MSADIIEFPITCEEHMILVCPDCQNTTWFIDLHLTLRCSDCLCTCNAVVSVSEHLANDFSELDFDEPA